VIGESKQKSKSEKLKRDTGDYEVHKMHYLNTHILLV
jgi:hypothetical protein